MRIDIAISSLPEEYNSSAAFSVFRRFSKFTKVAKICKEVVLLCEKPLQSVKNDYFG